MKENPLNPFLYIKECIRFMTNFNINTNLYIFIATKINKNIRVFKMNLDEKPDDRKAGIFTEISEKVIKEDIFINEFINGFYQEETYDDSKIDKIEYEEHKIWKIWSTIKIGNKYYKIYTSTSKHEICYLISDKPNENFTFGGVIISNGDIGFKGRGEEECLYYYGNIQGYIALIKDRYFIIYNRHIMKNQENYILCAEKIEIDKNGRINQVEMTSQGFLDSGIRGKGEFSSYIACNLMSKKGAISYENKVGDDHPYIKSEDDKLYVANICDGTVAGYKYFNFRNINKINVYTRGTGNGKIYIGSEPGERNLGKIKIKSSKNWHKSEGILNLENGKWPLYFEYIGDGYIDFLKFELI